MTPRPARLVISCPDVPGIVSAVSGFLYERGANITDSAQHSTDPTGGTFVMRMEFTLPNIEAKHDEIVAAFDQDVAQRFSMTWRLSQPDLSRIAILVSRPDQCLLDLIWRVRRGELPAQISVVISNHPDLEDTAQAFGIPFEHIPIPPAGMAAPERVMIERLEGSADLVVLARYMRILSPAFLDKLDLPVINIHHSFLPAFIGANPYQRALERGVKIIGATAHYVTEALDDGPIIQQDVQRVSHRHNLRELEAIGRDIERTVLARAVKWHLEDRVIIHRNKTFVFE